jgi:hypothetical protein
MSEHWKASYDHWKTGGDAPGYTHDDLLAEAQEAEEERRREEEDEDGDDDELPDLDELADDITDEQLDREIETELNRLEE